MQSKAWLATNRMLRAVLADDLLGLGVGLPVRFEIAGLLHRDDVVEGKADVGPAAFSMSRSPFDRIASL